MTALLSRSRTSAVAVVLAAGIVLGLAAGGVVAAPKEFDRTIPEKAVLYAGFKDFPQFLARFQQTPYQKLLEEEQVQDFFDQIVMLIENEAPKLAQLDLKADELKELLAGEVAIVVGELDVEQVAPVQALLVADITGKRELAQQMVNKWLATFAEELDEAGVMTQEEQFEGRTIVRMAPEDFGEQAVYYMIEDELLALNVGGRTLLEKFIVMQARGGLPAMADNENYGAAVARMGDDNDFVLFANFQALMDALVPEDQTPAGEPGAAVDAGPNVDAILKALGIRDVKALGLGVKLAEDGIRGRGILLTPAPRKGILKAFVPEDMDVTPPPFVDDDAAAYYAFHFSVPVLYEEIMNMLMTTAPPVHMMIQMQLQAMNTEAGVNVGNDIIKALGTRWHIYMPAEVVTANEPKMLNVVISLELADRDAIAGAFDKLLAFGEEGVAPIEFMGQSIYQLPADDFVEPDAPYGMELCFVFLENSVLVATNLDLAKTVIKNRVRDRSTLLETPRLQALLAHVMEDPDALTFEDTSLTGRLQVENPDPEFEELGLRLPDFDALRKYLGLSVSVMKWTDEGLLLETWAQYPRLED